VNVDIREHIINNFKDDSVDAIRESVLESIEKGDEITLPGLGVFFEILWNNSNDEDKNKMLTTIKDSLH
jgi:small acid-soluble spore protein I (minor)